MPIEGEALTGQERVEPGSVRLRQPERLERMEQAVAQLPELKRKQPEAERRASAPPTPSFAECSAKKTSPRYRSETRNLI
jgi:hypothetical protein